MHGAKYTFLKEERLCSKIIIDEIFARQQTLLAFHFPLLLIYKFRPLPTSLPAQVMFSISKRKIKKAHERNRIRRQLREIYRLHKNILYHYLTSQRLQCALVIVYNAKQQLPYAELQQAFIKSLEKLVATKP